MGLDLVELTIRFEDAFGVAIPDKVASDITTPREVTEYLVTQLNVGRRTSCISQQAFYRLRRELLPLTKTQRGEFRPTVMLSQLFPADARKEVWNEARSQIGVSVLPDLVRPKWLVYVLTILIVVTAIIMFSHSYDISGDSAIAFFLSVLVSGALAHASQFATRSLRSEFSREYTTAGDLANYLALHSPHAFKKNWTREEIAETVRMVIIDQTGVSDFHEDSRFVQDMHLD
ncbi:MAG TPA: hypothetical protein VGP83_11335 [Pyrinomonadaceae bacterium]|jgi:hypothetical protein|nr:hypothetical protein [Pyrinomonadaceae bacterium]